MASCCNGIAGRLPVPPVASFDAMIASFEALTGEPIRLAPPAVGPLKAPNVHWSLTTGHWRTTMAHWKPWRLFSKPQRHVVVPRSPVGFPDGPLENRNAPLEKPNALRGITTARCGSPTPRCSFRQALGILQRQLGVVQRLFVEPQRRIPVPRSLFGFPKGPLASYNGAPENPMALCGTAKPLRGAGTADLKRRTEAGESSAGGKEGGACAPPGVSLCGGMIGGRHDGRRRRASAVRGGLRGPSGHGRAAV